MSKKNSVVYGVFTVSVVAAILLSGCADRVKTLHKVAPVVEKEEKTASDQSISMSVVEMPVRKLMKSVCEANSLSCDFSAQPSDKYLATFNYNGPVEGLLGVIKRQTGINYTITDRMISLGDKDDITLYEDPLKKSKCDKEITVSFKNMTISDAFKYFYDEYGYSFTFDLRHTIINPAAKNQNNQPGLPVLAAMPINDKSGTDVKQNTTQNIAFYYNGCDPKEALDSFISSLDLTMVETRDHEFKVRDYDVAILDKSVYFDYSLTSGGASSGSQASGASTGSTTSSTGSSSSSAASSTTTVSTAAKHHDDLQSLLRHYLSENGKLDFSMRGYVVVEDKPSYIKRIKTIMKKEIEKEAPLSISINIIRIDLNDNYKAGVDWNAVWSKGLFGLRDLGVSSSMSGLVNGGFSVKGSFKGADQVLTMLQDYGDTKIERSSTISARSGFLANYEATKPIPYITTASTITGGTTGFAQGSITPMFEQEGIVLNILPSVNLDEKIVDLGIDVTVAEYAGDKSFDLGDQGIYTLPIVPKDKGRFAVQAKLGETIILTGFKVKKDKAAKKGIPGLSQLTGAGALFGYQEDLDESSEILIVLKVDQLKR